jgi:hypothetical protein
MGCERVIRPRHPVSGNIRLVLLYYKVRSTLWSTVENPAYAFELRPDSEELHSLTVAAPH